MGGHCTKCQPAFVFSAVSFSRNAVSVSCCRLLTFVSTQHVEFYLVFNVYLDYVTRTWHEYHLISSTDKVKPWD